MPQRAPSSDVRQRQQHWLKLSAGVRLQARRRRRRLMPACGVGWSWRMGRRGQRASSGLARYPSQQREWQQEQRCPHLLDPHPGHQMQHGWTASHHHAAAASSRKMQQSLSSRSSRSSTSSTSSKEQHQQMVSGWLAVQTP